MLFYIETGIGCCIRSAPDEDAAYRNALREVGTFNGVGTVREASKADIAFVKAMGGYVPDDEHSEQSR